MSWIPPKTTWVSTHYFNTSDWERIEDNAIFLNNKMQEVTGGSVTLFVIPLLYSWLSLPTVELVNKLESNIDALYNKLGLSLTGWLPRVDWYGRTEIEWVRNPNFADFNRWERNLLIMEAILDNIVLAYKYSGTFYSGQEVVL